MLVIFDMDGTLIDSMSIWSDAAERYIRSHGNEPKDSVGEAIYGTTVPQAIHIIHEKYLPEVEEQTIMDDITAQISRGYESVAAKSGVLQLLVALKARGVKTAVATASKDELVQAVLNRLGIDKYIDKLYCDVSKGTPDIFLKIADEMGERVSDCWMVEDALYSIKSAKAAGFKTLAIYDRSGEKEANEVKKLSDKYYMSFDNTDSILNSMGL